MSPCWRGTWYEAQLLHHGLPPSENKIVTKTHLLDTVNIMFDIWRNGEVVPIIGCGDNAPASNKRPKSKATASTPTARSEPPPKIPRARPIQTARKRDGNRDLGISRLGAALKQGTEAKNEINSFPATVRRLRAKETARKSDGNKDLDISQERQAVRRSL